MSESPSVSIVTGIPSRGKTHIRWSLNYATLQWPLSTRRQTIAVTGEQVATARNNLANAAIETGADYLFFIDDDVVMPSYAPQRMHYQMEQHPDWDLLSGIYVTKTAPPVPLIFGEDVGKGPFWDWRCGETFPIGGCGMGCAMIRVSAFEKFPEPWFAWTDLAIGMHTAGEGEDLYFCNRLAEAGGTLMADGYVLCGHIDLEKDAMYQIWRDSRPFKNALPEFLADHAAGYVPDNGEMSLISENSTEDRKRKKKPVAMSGIAGS